MTLLQVHVSFCGLKQGNGRAREEHKLSLSLASHYCRLSRSPTFLRAALLCLAKHLFGLRVSPRYVIKLSRFILQVRNQKSGAEGFSAGLSATFHIVFYHTLGKSICTFTLAHLGKFARDNSSADSWFLPLLSPYTLKERPWMAAIFLQLWKCVCNFSSSRIH